MALRPEDIDPTIQSLLKDRFAQIFQQHHAPMDPVSARVRSAGMAAWRNAASRNAGFFAGGVLGVLTTIFGPAIAAGSGQGNPGVIFLFAGTLTVGLLITGFMRTNEALTKYASPDVMRYAAAHLALSRGERAYCEAFAALLEAGSVLSDEVQRDVAKHLNGLLESYRRLEDPLRRAQAASATESINGLEQELAGLMSRRDAQIDAEARAMMEQSVELCRRRLEASRAVEPAKQKVEAQQELIMQTMASVHASLGRTTGVNIKASDLDLGELQQSVAQVNTQTRAVEEAVAEVVALSA